ncbi:hypothetical protein MGYG_01946 [Nannizzia gypsea CBS 118893]|uniref:Uncharacterized protein n=1 Tax=Arthroderma gypseum (strain ATCC MYA-4604 / CBS 118893) TaxID=535722 RepID=E5QZ24_ARTGP|nr:hypothetical protein MGYG_01946 [Nannizzia gypsea CBS 118893]EFQ98933.1 hypothetical protein MGYG_01946 [Nannizzia gypsea CBS 118893]
MGINKEPIPAKASISTDQKLTTDLAITTLELEQEEQQGRREKAEEEEEAEEKQKKGEFEAHQP